MTITVDTKPPLDPHSILAKGYHYLLFKEGLAKKLGLLSLPYPVNKQSGNVSVEFYVDQNNKDALQEAEKFIQKLAVAFDIDRSHIQTQVQSQYDEDDPHFAAMIHNSQFKSEYVWRYSPEEAADALDNLEQEQYLFYFNGMPNNTKVFLKKLLDPVNASFTPDELYMLRNPSGSVTDLIKSICDVVPYRWGQKTLTGGQVRELIKKTTIYENTGF